MRYNEVQKGQEDIYHPEENQEVSSVHTKGERDWKNCLCPNELDDLLIDNAF